LQKNPQEDEEKAAAGRLRLFCFLVLPISEFIEINYGIIPGKKIGDRPRKHWRKYTIQ
jgi:hypothetical protein